LAAVNIFAETIIWIPFRLCGMGLWHTLSLGYGEHLFVAYFLVTAAIFC